MCHVVDVYEKQDDGSRLLFQWVYESYREALSTVEELAELGYFVIHSELSANGKLLWQVTYNEFVEEGTMDEFWAYQQNPT